MLLAWWAAFYPGLFSRDSVLYLSHTTIGPWISDHSVLYDALLWLSVRGTGDISALTLLQTTAMAAAITYLASSLVALGAPRRWTYGLALALPFLPTLGAFSVSFWKDVPFTICAMLIAAVCARVAVDRELRPGRLAALGALFLALGLFRANGFLVVAIAVAVLVLVVRTMRVRLALLGMAAAAIPLVLSNLLFPLVGIAAPTKTYVYHTAFGDIAVAFHERPDLFDNHDRALLAAVAPLKRWDRGGTCATINPLIWRGDFSWPQADTHSGELLDLWKRLLVREPALMVDTRLCRGAIAWKIWADDEAFGGDTYRFSRRPNADTYVGVEQVPDYPERQLFTLRPLDQGLNEVAGSWLDLSLGKPVDWLLWRGAVWCYLAYLTVTLVAARSGNRYALGVAAVVAGQQLAILANISAQDFRYMASPIFTGILLLPLLLSSLRRRAS
ncbi:hypothetical protein OIE66_35630 [Nonomuraea sp. NBC_01738]|uniref:hypothetical protein n=1 Tax=Nonomuraea sp. NBC_01738 TaxID=2976003 RepID=UPI002E0FD63B|nr:hypothetical protein OIE66_35630 [Nonomuraea sp. NBC_01738]